MSNSDDEALEVLRNKLKNTGLRNNLDTIANDRRQNLKKPATQTPDISAYSSEKLPNQDDNEGKNNSLDLLKKHDKMDISDSTLSSMTELRNMKSENDLMREEINKLKSEINEVESKLDNMSRISNISHTIQSPQPNGMTSNNAKMRETVSMRHDYNLNDDDVDVDDNEEDEEEIPKEKEESFWHHLCWCCY